jgi:hypothetical protein
MCVGLALLGPDSFPGRVARQLPATGNMEGRAR